MKNTGAILTITALATVLGYYLTRPKPAGAEDLPPEDEDTLPPEDEEAPPEEEEPFTGMQFANLTATFNKSTVAVGEELRAVMDFDYRGEGGIYDIGVMLDASPTNVSTQRHTLPPSEVWTHKRFTTIFSGVHCGLPSGSAIDAMALIKLPGITFSFGEAAEMDLVTWYPGAITIASMAIIDANVGARSMGIYCIDC